jgi:motility quorum-sensing regulator/GCU-specific mRNA interferase toxin
MATKRVPHHQLTAVQAKFDDVNTLEITRVATLNARALGYSLENVVEVVQALEPRDFVKSATATNPPNAKVWHDTYKIPYDDLYLYLKFAGETLIDVVLTSFKEV